MDQTFHLRIVTPSRQVVAEEAEEAQIPGKQGYLGILPGHAPLISELQPGEIAYRQGREWRHLAVSGGFLEVLPDQVTVLAETAERADEIDVGRAQAAKQRAEESLRRPEPDANVDEVMMELQRANARLQVAAKGR